MLDVFKIDLCCPYWTKRIDGGILPPHHSYWILDQATNSNGAISIIRDLLRLRCLHNHHLRVLRRDIRHVHGKHSHFSFFQVQVRLHLVE